MNTIKKHINILLLGCCSLNFISCTDLTEEIFSDITEDSYKYEAGDATKVVGAAYTNLQDWGYCGSGQAPMLSQEICTDAAVFPANGSGWDDGGVFRRMLRTITSESFMGSLLFRNYLGKPGYQHYQPR